MTGIENKGERLGVQGVIINDCHDPNARARQTARFESLFGVTPAFVELEGKDADLQAAGQLVDVLDAAATPGDFPQRQLIALVNVAPRGGDVKRRWPNGTPFCYFETEDGHTVLSTFEGRSLSLARDVGAVSSVQLMDVGAVSERWVEEEVISPGEAERIKATQFRSNDFLPLAAWWIRNGREVPAEDRSLEGHPSVDDSIWWVDNFGNAKTTLRAADIGFEEGKTISRNGHRLICRGSLADVATGELAITIGSSGYGEERFLEIVEGRGRAVDRPGLDLEVGSAALELVPEQKAA